MFSGQGDYVKNINYISQAYYLSIDSTFRFVCWEKKKNNNYESFYYKSQVKMKIHLEISLKSNTNTLCTRNLHSPY